MRESNGQRWHAEQRRARASAQAQALKAEIDSLERGTNEALSAIAAKSEQLEAARSETEALATACQVCGGQGRRSSGRSIR